MVQRFLDELEALLSNTSDASGPMAYDCWCSLEVVLADAALHVPETDYRYWRALLRRVREGAIALCLSAFEAGGADMADGAAIASALRLLRTDCRYLDQSIQVVRRRLQTAPPGESWDMQARLAPRGPVYVGQHNWVTPLDHWDFATRCDWVGGMALGLVVGVRTIGSHLAPMWAAALRKRRVAEVGFVTVRPSKHGRRVLAKRELAELKAHLRHRPVRGVLLLEDCVSTGKTARAVEEAVIGVAGRATPCLWLFTDEDAGLDRWAGLGTRSEARRLAVSRERGPQDDPAAFFRRHVSAQLPAATVEGCQPLGPSYWHRYVGSRLARPDLLATTNLRKQRYRIRLRDGRRRRNVVAKYVGCGYGGQHEIRRLEALRAFTPRPVAYCEGYLLQEEVAGTSVRAEQPDGQVGALWRTQVEYAARMLRHFALGRVPVQALIDRAVEAVNDLQREHVVRNSEARRLVHALEATPGGQTFPLVRLSRNQGHWHWIRTPSGALWKTHCDVGEWQRDTDVLLEIASLWVELAAGRCVLPEALRYYRGLSGDRSAESRIVPAIVLYARQVWADFREREAWLEGICSSEGGRDLQACPREYAARRSRIRESLQHCCELT